MGLEPMTHRLKVCCCYHLSYQRFNNSAKHCQCLKCDQYTADQEYRTIYRLILIKLVRWAGNAPARIVWLRASCPTLIASNAFLKLAPSDGYAPPLSGSKPVVIN